MTLKPAETERVTQTIEEKKQTKAAQKTHTGVKNGLELHPNPSKTSQPNPSFFWLSPSAVRAANANAILET